MTINIKKEKDFSYKDFSKSDLKVKLARLARICENFKIPVLICVDGWESSGRGYVVSQLTKELNPKYFDVDVSNKDKKDGDYSFIINAWKDLPVQSHIKIFTHSYYSDLFENPSYTDNQVEERISEIRNMEKMLTTNNTIIIKIFLSIDEDVQKQRIKDLKDSVKKPFYISSIDKIQSENYKLYQENFKKILSMSDYDFASWNVIEANHMKKAAKEALGLVIDQMTIGIERVGNQEKDKDRTTRSYDKKVHILENLDLAKKLSKEEYKEKKNKLQKEVADTMYELYNKGISSALVFEGVDAAGKDGAIKRLIKEVDPILYRVHSISAPSQEELSKHYLRRFYQRLPQRGYTSIFSRSWYGRVMVERIEKLAKIGEWDRAYDEIKDFEKLLVKNKIMVLKFFVVIDKDVQLQRFKDRESIPDKQYKITDEDWRNRKKWDSYIEAMNEMLDRTNLDYAPWIIVEGNDKKYARIKVMEEYLKYAKKFIENN
ncbi:MAG: hypothetical protein PUG67_08315 [Peptoniphilaceae bacterium]|nr:hypothetical protein [Peptoniphilaceae bacterium]MDY6018871.1 hypothetical protein [Anaerococcus sp.]